MKKLSIEVLKETKYGKLIVLEEGIRRNGARTVVCKCDCGNIKTIRIGDIRSGATTSCGCSQVERSTKAILERAAEARGSLFPFDDKYHPFWLLYKEMLKRCYNTRSSSYADYGGRGILVYQPWVDDFNNFYTDLYPSWSEGLTLDRTDVNLGYFPDNVRWETQSVQSHNRRKSKNTSSKYIGVSKKGSKWAAYITKDFKNSGMTYLGHFISEEVAARAYDDASERLYGDRPNEKLGLLAA